MRVSDQVLGFTKRLHPAQRRVVKAALRSLDSGVAEDVLPLSDELEGFYRLRVGKFRIIFRYGNDRDVFCEFMDVRDTVYERFISLQEFLDEQG